MRGSAAPRRLLLALLLLLPSSAWANEPIPVLFGFVATAWLGILTVGVSFAVITAVEAAALVWVGRFEWREAMRLSAIANLITSALGLFFFLGAAPDALMVASVVAMVVCAGIAGSHSKWSAQRLLWNALAVAPIWSFLSLVWLDRMAGSMVSPLAVFGSLAPAGLLTTVIEWLYLRTAAPARRLLVPAVLGNLCSYALIGLLLLAVRMTPEEAPLMSPGMLSREADRAVQRGDVATALSLIDRYRRLQLGQSPPRLLFLLRQAPATPEFDSELGYPPFAEEGLARLLAEHHHPDEARAVLERLLATPGLADDQRPVIQAQLASLEATQ